MADGKQDNSDALLYAGLLVIGIIMILMYLLDKIAWLVNGIIGSIAWLHVLPFAMLGDLMPFLLHVPLLGPLLIGPCMAVYAFLAEGNFQAMTVGPDGARALVMSVTGRVAVLIYGPFLLKSAFTDTKVHVDGFYKKMYDLETMLREQARTWKVVRMFRKLDPLKSSEVKPSEIAKTAVNQLKKSRKSTVGLLISGYRVMSAPFGYKRSMTPEEWLVANGVTVSEKQFEKLNSGKMPATERDYTFPEQWEYIDIASITEVMRSQLRRPWRGVDDLPPVQKALFAIMTLFYGSKSDQANGMLGKLGDLANTLEPGKTGMDRLIKADKALWEEIGKVCASKHGKMMAHVVDRGHAWVESAFPTLLRLARFERGVFASASFIWLKQEDRTLWYILNSTGNDTAFVEAAGALAHNKAEIQLGGPLKTPRMFQAARALLHDYLNCSKEAVEKRNAAKDSKRKLTTQMSMMAQEAEIRLKKMMNEEENNEINAYTELADRAVLSKIGREYADTGSS